MAIQCPACGKQFDHTLFQFGREIICDCGTSLRVPSKKDETSYLRSRENAAYRLLQHQVDRVCTLILSSDVPEAMIQKEEAQAKKLCKEFFPDRLELFDLIYTSRFQRLRSQFRA